MEEPADDTPRRVKKARISLACTSCREHKTRCDGKKPVCSYCQRRNPTTQTSCIYQNQSRIRESQDIQNLLQRIGQLEGELASQRQANTDLDQQRPRKRDFSSLNHGHGQALQGGHASNGLLSASCPEGAAAAQDPQNETQASVQSQPDNATNDTTSRSPNVAGLQDLTGSEVPGADRVSDNGSLTNILQMPASEPFTDAPQQSRGGNLSIAEASQQAGRLEVTSSNISTTHAHAPQENDEPYFYGESSTTTLIEEVHEMISPSVHGNSGHSRDTPSASSTQIYPSGEDNVRAYCSKTVDDRNYMKDFDLPPRFLADHLINTYFDRVHVLYPFLHRPTFESAYEKLWAPATSDDMNGNCGRSEGLVDTGIGSASHSGPKSRVFYGAINTIFALSCQYSNMRISAVPETAKGYLERAMALVMNPDLLDRGSVSLVQVLLLLCLHLQSTPLRNRLWNIIGLAVRMAQGLGIQDEINDGQESGDMHDDTQTEIRRRVWYGCMMLDMTVGMTLGRAPICSEGYNVPLPRPLSDENLQRLANLPLNALQPPQNEISLVTFFIEAVKLTEFTDNMLKSIYSRSTNKGQSSTDGYKKKGRLPTTDIGIFMHLETTWTVLFNNVPSELCFTDEGVDSGSPTNSATQHALPFGYIERQRNVLNARFLHVKVLLYRPIFLEFCLEANLRNHIHKNQTRPTRLFSGSGADVETIKTGFSTHCATSCLRTATDLIHLVHATHSTKAASAWWYTIFYTYTSAVVIIMSRYCSPLTEADGISAIDETWSLCQEILNNMAIYGIHARRCLLSLEDLDSRLASWESGSNRPDVIENSITASERISHEQPGVISVHPNTSLENASREDLSGMRRNPFQSWARGENSESVYRDLNALEQDTPVGNLPFEPDPGQEMSGMLPWGVDINQWWTFNLDSAEFQDAATWC